MPFGAEWITIMRKASLNNRTITLILAAMISQTSIALCESPQEEAAPPFQLTPEEQKNVDQALRRWEDWNSSTERFECRFKCWKYDRVFHRSDEPEHIEHGVIFYSAPHRIKYIVDSTEKDGKICPIGECDAEKWSFDGKAICNLNYDNREANVYELPPEVNPDDLVDGPLSFCFAIRIFPLIKSSGNSNLPPFPFSAKAELLKRHYYIRIVTPEKNEDETWLEASPRTKDVAVFCSKVQLIFNSLDMSPFAIRIVEPNGKNYSVYQFYDIKRNHIIDSCW